MKNAPRTSMKMLRDKTLEPMVAEAGYSNIPNKSKGTPNNMSTSAIKITNALGSAIIYYVSFLVLYF